MDNITILKDLRELIFKSFGNILDKIILFGSRESGFSDIESDYDILIILKEDYDWKTEREIYDLCYEINLKYDILIDVKIISTNELQSIRGKQPYILQALESGLQI